MPALPSPRGEVSDTLVAALADPAHALRAPRVAPPADALADEDVQLALYVMYELHYRGFDGVDERWEWEPSLLALRRELEDAFTRSLYDLVGAPEREDVAAEEMDVALRAIAEADDGPSLSRHLERSGTLDEVLEFVVHRSAYQLKEADPHAWAIPRLTGQAKAAIVEIEADEFGGGRADRIHAVLFAQAMEELGLDPAYGAYLDRIPALTLATVNLMSLLGLHRRWRGAVVGHLALFEMTSSVPNRRYGNALRRHGLGERATAFFDVHVEADAVHEAIAAVDLAGGLVRTEPALAGDVLWGARALATLEARWSAELLSAWEAGRSSLLAGLGEATAA
jgi:Iron-containing redox enzyme